MPKRRVIYKNDGSVDIVIPAPKSRFEGEPEDVWLKRVFDRAIEVDPNLQGLDYDDVDTSEIPSDRKDRNAWTRHPSGKGIGIDNVKAQKNREETEAFDLVQEEMKSMALANLKDRGQVPSHVAL